MKSFQPCSLTACLAAAVGVGLLVTSGASAATLSGSFSGGVVQPADLTAQGSLDWRIWDDPADTNDPGDDWANPAPVHNEKLAGTAVSALTYADPDNNSDNTFFSPDHTYTYTDGTSPTSATTGQLGLGFLGTLAGIDDDSLTFSVATVNTQEHTLTIYGAQRRSGSTLTLTLDGATTEVDTFAAGAAGTNIQWVYTATFTPDTAGDLLTVALTSSGTSTDAANGSNSVRIGAAAVSVIPEPASLALLGLGGLALMGQRRTQR